MFNNLTFSKKLLFAILSVVFLSLSTTTYLITVKSFNSAEYAAKEKLRNIAELNSYKSKEGLTKSLILIQTIASTIENSIIRDTYSKKEIVEVTKSALKEATYVVGMAVDFEANKLFANDKSLSSKFGHDDDGRFSPYIYKSGSSINTEGLTTVNEPREWFDGAKKSKKEYITEPYMYKVDGKDVLMVTLSYPIKNKNSEIIGVVTADISLEDLEKEIYKIKIFESGYGFIISQDGTIIAHPKKAILGKKINEITKDKNDLLVASKIKTKKEFEYNVVSINNGQVSINYIYPFKIANSDVNWGFGISVPEAEYLITATEIKWFSIIAGIISFIIIALVILYNTRILGRNLDAISHGASSFFKYLNKESSTSEKISINSNDEFGIMANEINKNVEKIETGLKIDQSCVNEVLQIVEKIKNGHLNNKIQSQANNPELVKLSDNFNEMLSVLQSKVGVDLNDISFVLENFSKYDFTSKVKNSDGEIEEAINNLGIEISNLLQESLKVGLTLDIALSKLLTNVDTLNKNSNETAASLEETAAALEEITSTIINNTENISKMSSSANDLSVSAKKGQELAHNTTSAMDDITEQVNLINEAISVIDQIAFQTNILSLNAAVEAATAGESGKGFAVVAAEVRNLASRSAEAAKEIKDLVESATSKASQGKAISADMIKGYEGLLENIKGATEMIGEISMASREQQTGITQINDAITNLDSQTQENANIANQTQDIATQSDVIAKEIVSDANKKEFIGKNETKKFSSK